MTYNDCDYITGNHRQAVIINFMPKQNLVGHILKRWLRDGMIPDKMAKYTGHKLLSTGNTKANPTILQIH
jgi:hypothetical protein